MFNVLDKFVAKNLFTYELPDQKIVKLKAFETQVWNVFIIDEW